MHTFFIAPSGFGVGLTSTSLGLVGALERAGLRVGFFKPIAQPHPGDTGPERSSELVARTHGLRSPTPLALGRVEQMLGEGRLDELLEEILAGYRQAAQDKDVVIVEAMVPTRQTSYAARVNFHLARSLEAEVILVAAPEQESPAELCDRLAIHAQQFGGPQDPKVLGVILNKVRCADGVAAYAQGLKDSAALLRGEDFRLLGCIPWQEELNAPRTRDIAELLGARLLNAGDYQQRRVLQIVLCARAVANTIQLLQPGTLVVTPGDRDDIILAASLAAMNGVPLAGLLLCSDFNPDPRIMELCRGALHSGLPVMTVSSGSFDTASNLNRLNREIPLDDRERAEKVAEFVASHVDHDWLGARCASPRAPQLSPAAFRFQLLQRARAAARRIVLPEGAEPRTIQAAALCQARGIARCVLLARPEEVRALAQAQGLALPADLEILDPELVRERYVAPMVELRQDKGLNAPMAAAQLEDNVVLGTLMLALGEADGLVSGALHPTANTIRPALQLIKTAPGYSLVSSVCFLLLPEQVLVYGDCAVNPEPSAAQLAEIAVQSAESARACGIAPRLVLLCPASGDSGRVAEAIRLARLRCPDLEVDGPVPLAADGRPPAPHAPAGDGATVYLFPDLDSGNRAYKALLRDPDCIGVGPMLQGLRKPVNDLPRGAQVDDILYTIALTAIQAASLPQSPALPAEPAAKGGDMG